MVGKGVSWFKKIVKDSAQEIAQQAQNKVVKLGAKSESAEGAVQNTQSETPRCYYDKELKMWIINGKRADEDPAYLEEQKKIAEASQPIKPPRKLIYFIFAKLL